MAITTYRPLSLIEQINRGMGGLPEGANFSSEEWSPAVDIKETEAAFIIHADLPGVKPEQIEVTTEGGTLTIKGSRESSKKEERKNYSRVERFSGSFMRRFTLPEQADCASVSAETADGVLELTIPKIEKAKQQKITVKKGSH